MSSLHTCKSSPSRKLPLSRFSMGKLVGWNTKLAYVRDRYSSQQLIGGDVDLLGKPIRCLILKP